MSDSPAPSHAVFDRFSGATVLLWLRPDLERDEALAYWRGPHAQLVARTPGTWEYRQHHFDPASSGLWPPTADVSTTIGANRRIDGSPEVTFSSALAPLRSMRHGRAVLDDEQNVFARTCLYLARPFDVRWYRLSARGAVGFRSVALLRRRPDVSPAAFRRVVNEVLAPMLADCAEVSELRSQILRPYFPALWNAPGVAHDSRAEEQYQASICVGAASASALDAALRSVSAATSQALRHHCAAIHAYAVSATYTFAREGRATLPQLKPVAKPPLKPVRRTVPKAPNRASQTLDNLGPAELVLPGAPGPEDVVIDALGRPVCGLADGRIVRIDLHSKSETVLGHTGGRPLGLEILADGGILVCDAHCGLLRLDPESGRIETLVQFVDGVPLRFCSNASAADDGTIWFTESTRRFDLEQYMGSLLEAEASGRLYRRDPDGRVTIVLDGLHFPNGITVTEDQTAVLFAETAAHRISRLQVRGPLAGTVEVLADNLPGFPDNLSRMRGGRFWVAMAAPRTADSDRLGTLPGLLRRVLWKLPDHWLPKPPRSVWVMAFDGQGRVVADRQGVRPDYGAVTGVAEHAGDLYLAGVDESGLLKIACQPS